MKPSHPESPVGLLPEPDDGTHWFDPVCGFVWTRFDAEAEAYKLGDSHWFVGGQGYPYTWSDINAERDVTKWVQLIPAETRGGRGPS